MEALADERACERSPCVSRGFVSVSVESPSTGFCRPSSDSLRWSVRSDKDDGRFLMSATSFYPPFQPHSHSGASAPIFQPHPPPILYLLFHSVPVCWCCLMGHTQARSVFSTAFGSLSASDFRALILRRSTLSSLIAFSILHASESRGMPEPPGLPPQTLEIRM